MDATPPVLTKGEQLPYTKRPFLGKLVNKIIGVANAVLCTEITVVAAASASATSNSASRWDISPTRSIITVAIPMVSSSGTNPPGWNWTAGQRNYDHTKTYQDQTVIYVQPTDSMVTSGTLDPDSLSTVKATAGMWVALQTVAPVTVSGTTAYHIPHLPLPTPGDMDASNNYWAFVSPDATCV